MSICTRCGRIFKEEGYKVCGRCRNYFKYFYNLKKKNRNCFLCGKESSKLYCESCYKNKGLFIIYTERPSISKERVESLSIGDAFFYNKTSIKNINNQYNLNLDENNKGKILYIRKTNNFIIFECDIEIFYINLNRTLLNRGIKRYVIMVLGKEKVSFEEFKEKYK